MILFLLLGSFYTQAEAKASNVKDCIENKEDCSESAGNQTDDNITEDGTDSAKTGNQSLILDLIKMALALLLVLALIYFLLKFLNKRNNLSQHKSLQNLGGISVGPSKSVQIIRVGKKLYLIGVGENVDMLKEITDELLIEELLNQSVEKNDFQFGTILSKFSKVTQKDDENSTQSTDQPFKEMFSNELASLKENRSDLIKEHKQRKDKNE